MRLFAARALGRGLEVPGVTREANAPLLHFPPRAILSRTALIGEETRCVLTILSRFLDF